MSQPTFAQKIRLLDQEFDKHMELLNDCLEKASSEQEAETITDAMTKHRAWYDVELAKINAEMDSELELTL